MANRYWVRNVATPGLWSDTSNWGTSSGGAGGSSVPGSSDDVFFDGNGLDDCTVDQNVNVNSITFHSGSDYSSTFDCNSYTIQTANGIQCPSAIGFTFDASFSTQIHAGTVNLHGGNLIDIEDSVWTMNGGNLQIDSTSNSSNASSKITFNSNGNFEPGNGCHSHAEIEVASGISVQIEDNTVYMTEELKIGKITLNTNATLDFPHTGGKRMELYSTGTTLASGSNLTGNGEIRITSPSGTTPVTTNSGVIDVFIFSVGESSITLVPGNYECTGAFQYRATNTNFVFTLQSGNYYFNHFDVSTYVSPSKTLIINMTSGTTFNFKGNFTTSSSCTWNHNDGLLKFTGANSGTQNLTFNGATVGDIEVDDTGCTKIFNDGAIIRNFTNKKNSPRCYVEWGSFTHQINGDLIFGWTYMQTATLNCYGDVDFTSVDSPKAGTSTTNMYGLNKEIKGSYTGPHDVNFHNDTLIRVLGDGRIFYCFGTATIKTGVTVTINDTAGVSDQSLLATGGFKIESGAELTGTGRLNLGGTEFTQHDGLITTERVYARSGTGTAPTLPPGIYSCTNKVLMDLDSTASIVDCNLLAGTYTFNCDFEINTQNSGTGAGRNINFDPATVMKFNKDLIIGGSKFLYWVTNYDVIAPFEFNGTSPQEINQAIGVTEFPSLEINNDLSITGGVDYLETINLDIQSGTFNDNSKKLYVSGDLNIESSVTYNYGSVSVPLRLSGAGSGTQTITIKTPIGYLLVDDTGCTKDIEYGVDLQKFGCAFNTCNVEWGSYTHTIHSSIGYGRSFLESATFNCYGDIDFHGIDNTRAGTSTVNAKGNNNYISGSYSGPYNLNVENNYEIRTKNQFYVYGAVTVKAGAVLDVIHQSGSGSNRSRISVNGMKIESGAELTGDGYWYHTGDSFSQNDGIVTISWLRVRTSYIPDGSNTLAPGNYACTEKLSFEFDENSGDSNYYFSAGNFNFNCDVVFQPEYGIAPRFANIHFDAGTVFEFKKNLTFIPGGKLRFLTNAENISAFLFNGSSLQTITKDVDTGYLPDLRFENDVVIAGTESIHYFRGIDIQSGTFDDGNKNLYIAGDINIEAAATYSPGSGLITLTGSGISGGRSGTTETITLNGKTLNAVTIDDAGHTKQINDLFELNGKLDFQNGSFDTNNQSLILNNNFECAAGITWIKGSGTITMDGAGDHVVDTDDAPLNDMIISKNSSITLDSNLTADSLSINSGDFDANGYDVTVGDIAIATTGTIFLGEGTWNVSGDITGPGTAYTWNPETSTVKMLGLGSSKNINFNSWFYDLEIIGASIYSDTSGSAVIENSLEIKNSLTVQSGTGVYLSDNGTLYLRSGSALDGDGSFTIQSNGSLSDFSGNIRIFQLYVFNGVTLPGGVYESDYIDFVSTVNAGNESFVFASSLNYHFNSNVTFRCQKTSLPDTFTIDLASNNPNVRFYKNVYWTTDGGGLAWIKGSNDLEFFGVSDSDLQDDIGLDFEQFTINKTGADVQFDSDFSMESIVIQNGTLNANNADMTIYSGNFELQATGSYLRGLTNGKLYFTSTGNQSIIDNKGDRLDSIYIQKTSGVFTFATDVEADGFYGNEGDIDLGGKTFTFHGPFSIDSDADITPVTSLNGCTINCENLSLNGGAGNVLDLKATATWFLNVSGITLVTYCDVANSDASGGIEIFAIDGTTIDSGNNINWVFSLVKRRGGTRVPILTILGIINEEYKLL